MPVDAIQHLLISSRSTHRDLSRLIGRALDVTVAVVAMIAMLPLMGLIALGIAIEGKGPLIFRHMRVGEGDRRFYVLKFRTMCRGADEALARHLTTHPEAQREWAADHKLRVDPRVSRLGAFLRRTSLDELPQLWNVLRGEMSIVGPRPIVEAEIIRYGAHFAAYCSVRPGITGIWQVSGRNDLSYKRRVRMDAIYARKKSALLDLRIMLATIPAVLSRRGSY